MDPSPLPPHLHPPALTVAGAAAAARDITIMMVIVTNVAGGQGVTEAAPTAARKALPTQREARTTATDLGAILSLLHHRLEDPLPVFSSLQRVFLPLSWISQGDGVRLLLPPKTLKRQCHKSWTQERRSNPAITLKTVIGAVTVAQTAMRVVVMCTPQAALTTIGVGIATAVVAAATVANGTPAAAPRTGNGSTGALAGIRRARRMRMWKPHTPTTINRTSTPT